MNTVSTGAVPRGALARGAAAGLAAALALALAVFMPLTAPAGAEENAGITVTNMQLTRVNGNNQPQDGQIMYYDNARLTFDWDASNADLKPGDSFTINLGTYFENLQQSESLPMSVDHNGSDVEVGTCELTAKDIVCTFSDKVSELRSQGFHGFKGQGTALLAIAETTDSATADITANGTDSVALPGENGGIGAGTGYGDWEVDKWASSFYNNYSELTWGVNFGSNFVANELGSTFDGKTRQTVTFTDDLGEGAVYSTDMSRWQLHLKYVKDDSSVSDTVLTSADGTDATTEHGDFDVQVKPSSNGRSAAIEVTGPFAPDADYCLEYPVTFDGGQAKAGVSYANTVSLDGSEASDTETRSYVQYFDISVEMERGFGSFNINKTIEGDAAIEAAGRSFVVDVAYELPAAASSYPDWTAPEGTAPSGDERSGTTSVTVTAGEGVQFNGTFPQGTKVTLSEDTSQVAPVNSDSGWGTPVFMVDGEKTETFTIGDQTSTSVSLINTAGAPVEAAAPGNNNQGGDDNAQGGNQGGDNQGENNNQGGNDNAQNNNQGNDQGGDNNAQGGNQGNNQGGDNNAQGQQAPAATASADPGAAAGGTGGSGGSSLARTGANTAVFLAVVGLTLGGGGALLVARRRSKV